MSDTIPETIIQGRRYATADPWGTWRVSGWPESGEPECIAEGLFEADARLLVFGGEMVAALEALVRAGWEDGRYLAICQQDEWAAAVRAAESALANVRGTY